MERLSWIYITGSVRLTLYIGVTTSLESRIPQHKTKKHAGFTDTYNCDRLLHFEEFSDIENAIAREKQIKGWRRKKKLALISRMNPEMRDLAADWFPQDVIDEVRVVNLEERAVVDAEILRLRCLAALGGYAQDDDDK